MFVIVCLRHPLPSAQVLKYEEAEIEALLDKAIQSGQQPRPKSEEGEKEGEEPAEFGAGLEHVSSREWGEEKEIGGDAEDEGGQWLTNFPPELYCVP